MTTKPLPAYLRTAELAERWCIAPKTLANMRSRGTGPAFVKLTSGTGGAVRYALADVLAYEEAHRVEVAA